MFLVIFKLNFSSQRKGDIKTVVVRKLVVSLSVETYNLFSTMYYMK